MYSKEYKIKINLYQPLTEAQELAVHHLITMKLKELEYCGPNGNAIQKAVIIESN